jgi:cystathionine beta-lyase
VRWLQTRPEVARILHPALPDHPGHAAWKRDFSGAAGLFSIVLRNTDRAQLGRMLDGFALFGIGFSWGGFESLVLPADVKHLRGVAPDLAGGQLLRLHVGLEDVADLKADLERGFARLVA